MCIRDRPEALKAAGAQGVVINHCEKPMTLTAIRQTIERARELDLISFVCADTLAEAQAVAHFSPCLLYTSMAPGPVPGAVHAMKRRPDHAAGCLSLIHI